MRDLRQNQLHTRDIIVKRFENGLGKSSFDGYQLSSPAEHPHASRLFATLLLLFGIVITVILTYTLVIALMREHPDAGA